MNKRSTIPIHRMDDWFAGIYLKPMTIDIQSNPNYEMSVAHRDDFYYCILLDQGNMDLDVDLEKILLHDRSLFFSYPGQVHQINFMQIKKGWFLAFDPENIDKKLKSILDQFLTEIVSLKLTKEETKKFYGALEDLFAIYQDKGSLFRQQTVVASMTSFIYRLASAYLSVEGFSLSTHSERNIEITKRFKQMLRLHYRTLRRPAAFATALNITVSHLNDTIRSVTGFPVTYHIQQELMREARRLLCYSDLSVKEISDSLGFDDAKYFNRLFSHLTGNSPGSFRKAAVTPTKNN